MRDEGEIARHQIVQTLVGLADARHDDAVGAPGFDDVPKH